MSHVESIKAAQNQAVEDYVNDQVAQAAVNVAAPLEEEISQLTAQLAETRDELADTQERLGAAQEVALDLQAQVDSLQQQLADCQNGSEPEPITTVFGSCPPSPGGESLAAALRVSEKYGSGIAVRQFKGNNFNAPSVHETFELVHTSYKRSIEGIASGQYDAEIAALAQATPDGYVLEVWHESDKKVRDGAYSFSVCVAAKNRFYDVVKATKPSVLVANTITGWQADPKSNYFNDVWSWGQAKADIFGIDCDGIHSFPYPNYDDEIETALSFIDQFADNGYRFWSVPEFGAPRKPEFGDDGTARAQWLTEYGQKFRAAGALYVCAYEYESTVGNEFTAQAEIDAWKAFVA